MEIVAAVVVAFVISASFYIGYRIGRIVGYESGISYSLKSMDEIIGRNDA